jgi:hypothetical protein
MEGVSVPVRDGDNDCVGGEYVSVLLEESVCSDEDENEVDIVLVSAAAQDDVGDCEADIV